MYLVPTETQDPMSSTLIELNVNQALAIWGGQRIGFIEYEGCIKNIKNGVPCSFFSCKINATNRPEILHTYGVDTTDREYFGYAVFKKERCKAFKILNEAEAKIVFDTSSHYSQSSSQSYISTKPMKGKELINILQKAGWTITKNGNKGAYTQFEHPIRTNKIIVPNNYRRPLSTGVLQTILSQAGLK